MNAKSDNHLERGRRYYEQRNWADAYRALSLANQETPLAAEDLELLAIAAYLVGRDEEYLSTLEHAHNAYLNVGQCPRAVRCAFWLGLHLLMRGEMGRARGWLGLAERLLGGNPREFAERSYLLLYCRCTGPPSSSPPPPPAPWTDLPLPHLCVAFSPSPPVFSAWIPPAGVAQIATAVTRQAPA